MTAAHPMDPTGTDIHADATALREAGAACPVVLPGDVPGMIISRHHELRDFLADPKIAKNVRHFAAYREGRVPAQWQLNAFALADGMTTADGDDHRRLRGLATKAFTPRRVAAMRPWIEKLTTDLLAALPQRAAEEAAAFSGAGTGAGAAADASADADAGAGPSAGGGADARADTGAVVDLRRHFAYPLPMGVISELLGVDLCHRDRLHDLTGRMVDTSGDAGDAMAARAEIRPVLAQVVRDRRAAPGDDLTSALIAARDEDRQGGAERLSDEELTGTLLLVIIAGHETTLNLITNAVRALSGHPDQLALALAGEVSWDAVVEETLRWDSPVANFPFRYPTTDVVVDGVTIPRGTPVLAGYAAAGRDPREYGPDAGRFDITRPATRHLAFGHGPHYCLGAPLARLETVIALRDLYAAYPALTLAVPDASLPPHHGFVGNSVSALPVRLNGRRPR